MWVTLRFFVPACSQSEKYLLPNTCRVLSSLRSTMRILRSVLASQIALFACAASALSKRESCGLWDTIHAGPYTIYQNVWGSRAATSGRQCSSLNYVSGDHVSWNTVWDWQGGPGSVKSFANVELKFSTRQLGSISSIPTTWQWG